MFIYIKKVIETSSTVVYHIICDGHRVDSLMKIEKDSKAWVTTRKVVPTRVAMAAKSKILRHLKNKGEYPLTTTYVS